jgi:tetratricopeptide (TPR) repeat protein
MIFTPIALAFLIPSMVGGRSARGKGIYGLIARTSRIPLELVVLNSEKYLPGIMISEGIKRDALELIGLLKGMGLRDCEIKLNVLGAFEKLEKDPGSIDDVFGVEVKQWLKGRKENKKYYRKLYKKFSSWDYRILRRWPIEYVIALIQGFKLSNRVIRNAEKGASLLKQVYISEADEDTIEIEIMSKNEIKKPRPRVPTQSMSEYFNKRLVEIHVTRQPEKANLLEKARAELQIRKYKEARKLAIEALEKGNFNNEQNIELYYILSQSCLRLSEYDEAIEQASKGLELNFRHIGLLLVKSEAYFKKKDFKKAEQEAVKAEGYAPGNTLESVRLYVLLHSIMKKQNKKKKAEKYARKAKESVTEYFSVNTDKLYKDVNFAGVNPEFISVEIGIIILNIVSCLKLTVFDSNLLGQIAGVILDNIAKISIKKMLENNMQEKDIKQILKDMISESLTFENEFMPLSEEWTRQFGIEGLRINRGLDEMIKNVKELGSSS